MTHSNDLGRGLSAGSLSLNQRGKGPPRWVLTYTDSNGRRHRKALSTDRRVAERLRTEIIRQRDLEVAGLAPVEGMSMPLSELRDDYLADLATRVGSKQLVNVRLRLGKILGGLAAQRVRDLRVVDVLRYRAGRVQAGAANRTANCDVAALQAMLNWAVQSQLIAQSPLRGIKRLPTTERHQRRIRRALTEAEIQRLYAAAEDDDRRCATRHARVQRVPQLPLWRGLLETGARWGELTAVTWADLDANQCSLSLRAANTKSGRPRTIPLRREVLDELLALRAVHRVVRRRIVQPGDRVFLSPDGADWASYTTNVRRLLQRLLERAGIERKDSAGRVIDIHALRHTALTRLGRRGVPLVVTQRIAGHRDASLTAKVYTHIDLDDMRAAIDSMGSPPPPPLRAVPGKASEATA